MSERRVAIDGRTVRLSNLERVMWPATGFTKAELISYYVDIGNVILPHLVDRPLTLKRYPEGVEGGYWFQKQCRGHPDWMPTKPVASVRVEGKILDFCVVNELAALVWVANQGTIELHPLLALADDVQRPTAVAFDLDPGAPAGLVDAADIALRVRDVLSDVGLRSFAKTSGKGLHVYVPLNGPVTYAETKPFSRAVARLLASQDPQRVTDRMDKSLRPGKVFIDWSQNDPTKTTVVAYSLRARRHPIVSTPVGWNEVADAVAARDPSRLIFTASQVVARVRERGDLFADVLDVVQPLPAL